MAIIQCPTCGSNVSDQALQCPKCGSQIQGSVSTMHGGIPESIKGWNWGAFFFNWLWGVCNGVYWPLILLIPYVGWSISLFVMIALGLKGNEWAWKAKSWSSVAEFKRVQHKWAVAALWIFIVSIVLLFIIGIGIAMMEDEYYY